MATSRFIIKRRDKEVDDITLQSEGLTIGRLTGNNLALNHRSVSRTHAGIKEFNGEFWVFNLSESNGTVVNGWIVDKTPLLDGDVIQIGAYTLLANYVQGALSLTIQMDMDVRPIDGGATRFLSEGEVDKTVLVQIPAGVKKQQVAPGGTKRFQGTGILTGVLPMMDEQALKVFWEKRKREAGKIAPKTPLHPAVEKRVGKARWNWRPSLDLARIWRKSYFYWGFAIVALLSVAAAIIYADAYSPGVVSKAHSALEMSNRQIAVKANQNSCSNCHGVAEGMQDKCVSCHTTPTFSPVVFDAHARENIGCIGCHMEHRGEGSGPGLLSSGLCANCHNGTYTIKTGEKSGSLLPEPHGGTIGYPVVNGKWNWFLDKNQLRVRKLPDTWADAGWDSNRQFHAIHQMGRMNGRMSCKDCHTAGTRPDNQSRETPASKLFRETPARECAKCHNLVTGSQGTERVQANCYTCHRQHGNSQDLAKLVAEGKDERRLKDYFTKLNAGILDSNDRLATSRDRLFSGTGGADKIRQDKETFSFHVRSLFGGMPWYGWVGLVGLVPVGALAVMVAGTFRRKYSLKTASVEARQVAGAPQAMTNFLDIEKLAKEGPAYPRPVVNPLTCIGCHACVEACPHDVLAIVNGISTPINPDQCMEDTSCQVECPTNPKSCVVINTKKVIPVRKVPKRDQRFKTNVEGIYLIGDVSGVPLIKNAINEGSAVVDSIMDDLKAEGQNGKAEYDVAIVGIGPAGLSAAVIAKQRGLKYLALEQDQVVATIQQVYPAGKYVFFKPDTVDTKGGIPLPGAGDSKENMLKGWFDAMLGNNVTINEEESCKDIKKDGDLFRISTEQGKAKEKASYTARKIIIAIGNRGTPMKLRVPGEELKIMFTPPPQLPKFCPKCGTTRKGTQKFCVACGTQYPLKPVPPYETGKVQYKLSNPDDYVNKKCIVVGAGNSAIEAAVDLAGLKREGEKIIFTRTNDVTLVVRSDFKGDLKLGNKMNVYDCIDAGRIKVHFRTEIKEIKENEVALMDVKSKEEKARIPNDFIFALIGGEKPTKFLEAIGVKIGEG